MKRFLTLAILAAAAWCVPAFGAESILLLRNGEAFRPSQGIIRENGALMLSLEDLAELTESGLRQDGDTASFVYRMEGGPVVLAGEYSATMVSDGTLYDRRGRKIPLAGSMLRKDGRTWLPARAAAEALGYTVKWSRAGGAETLSVERPVMPRITMDTTYNKAEQSVTSVLRNREPQSFTYGAEFTLERMTANGWERVREAEIKDIDDYGLILPGRLEGISTGEREDTRHIYQPLPAGRYRLGLPFHFTYYIGVEQEMAESFWKDKLADWQSDPSPEHSRNLQWGLEYYYATKWAAPAFFFHGAEQELSNEAAHALLEGWYRRQENTSYVLYGEFEVE